MDITGARWGLNGAEAILKLRAVHANGDFDDYWAHHTAQERRGVHQSRYANAVIHAPPDVTPEEPHPNNSTRTAE